MNPLSFPQQVRAISLLTEGNSIRATERLTGVHRDTIMRLSRGVSYSWKKPILMQGHANPRSPEDRKSLGRTAEESRLPVLISLAACPN